MIDSYDFGEIVIDGKHYTSDVIIYPDRIDANWWRKEGHELHPEDLTEVVEEKPAVLVVGTGKYGLMEVLPETWDFLQSRGIRLIVEETDDACQAYNRLLGSERVVAALHLTC